ncbi:hypothetical protein T484DRAFT_1622553, partial [Baffinella frigidus]
CKMCGKSLSTTGNLVRHMRTHSGERPHVCETCGKTFSRSGNLYSHMRTHSGERPHGCEICGKALSTSSSLARHMRSHSGEKPYVCETCAFSQSGNLAKHMQTFAWPGTCGVNPESLREILFNLTADSEVERIVTERLGGSDEEMSLMELGSPKGADGARARPVRRKALRASWVSIKNSISLRPRGFVADASFGFTIHCLHFTVRGE